MDELPYKHPAILYNDIPHDATRHEDDSAWSTVVEIQNALMPYKADIILIPYPCSREDMVLLIEKLQKLKTDYVFNFCEEVNGDSYYEGCVAGVLELLKIPFSGNPAEALFFCRDKYRVSMFLKSAGVPVPESRILYTEKDIINIEEKKILKPACEDGSFGLSKCSVCSTRSELTKAFREARKLVRGPLLLEDYIEGPEINASMMDGEAFAFSEVIFDYQDKTHPNILTYEAKWENKSEVYQCSKTVCPATIEKSLQLKIKKLLN